MKINSKVLIGIIAVIVLSCALYYFIRQQYQPAKSPIVNGTTQNQNTTNSNLVTIQNFVFNPGTLTVKVGTKVTWTNQDSVTHKIKSDTFNSVDLNQGDMFTYTFTTKGNFDYSCGIHPSMTGKVVVE